MLSDYSAAHPDSFPLNIACGYELYDPDEDYDIGDTLRRADKIMYNEKFEMKKKNNEQVRWFLLNNFTPFSYIFIEALPKQLCFWLMLCYNITCYYFIALYK